jgi:stress-induced morphogen
MIEQQLREKLAKGLKPIHFELVNESPMHGLPIEAEKHFKLVAVSEVFVGLSRIERHRLVHDLVAEELKTHVHAFSVQAFAPSEWKGATFDSPECLGGGKREGLS